MATNLPNRAQITYNFGDMQGEATSNTTNTTLLDQYTMTVTKDAVNTTVRPGGDAVYVVRVDNNGSGTLYNVTVTDDLGTPGATDPLTYVAGTARFYINGTEVMGTVTINATNVAFSIQTPLQPGDNLIIFYAAQLNEAETDPVTNTVTATANTGSCTGDVITATDCETINPECFASVTIFKAADQDTVVSGDTLTYTLTLMNTGNEAATDINFVDALPEEFTVTSVFVTQNGTTTPISADDYTITPPNTLTIPAAGSSLEITVPAADGDGPGVTIITVTGTIE